MTAVPGTVRAWVSWSTGPCTGTCSRRSPSRVRDLGIDALAERLDDRRDEPWVADALAGQRELILSVLRGDARGLTPPG